MMLGPVAAFGIWTGSTAAVAVAGPGADADADAVINELWAQGYRVIVTKIGGGDSPSCAIKSVARQSPITDVPPNRDMQNKLVVTSKVARVTLLC
ncbi:Uncharacterised protein [Mycobacteroides abscessus subsp. abscessus]|nr:Uncharacterised protein [Mycobacteroides abscessus subsp. abscessus]